MPMKWSGSTSRIVCSMSLASSCGVRPRSRTRTLPASTSSRMKRIISSVPMRSTVSWLMRWMAGAAAMSCCPTVLAGGGGLIASPEVLGDGVVEGVDVRALAGGHRDDRVLREGGLERRRAGLGQVDLVGHDDDRQLARLEVARSEEHT